MLVLLKTERLVLRRFTEADVDALCELDGDPKVMRFITGGETTPRDVIRDDTLLRFAGADVDARCELDGAPKVMRFVTGGETTPRDVIRDETLPRFIRAYERFEGFGVWAAVERSTGEFLGWFEFYPPDR